MTVLFFGGEMGAFIPSDSNVIEQNALVDYDAGFSRCGITMTGSSAYCESADFTSSDTVWVHFAIAATSGSGTSSTVKILTLANSGGTDLVRINVNYASSSSHTVSLEYWNGSSYASTGSFTINLNNYLHHMDLFVSGNSASGTLALYVAGTERISATVDLSSVLSMTNARSYGRGSVSDMAISQVVVSTTSTIGMRVGTITMTGAGATGDWTGTYTDIDEMAYSDADFLNTSTAGQFELATGTAVPTLTGYVVRAVAVTARARRGASGPQNLRLVLRSGGANYDNGADLALGLGYGAYCSVWETNPATAAAWVNTAISSLQFGVKSIA